MRVIPKARALAQLCILQDEHMFKYTSVYIFTLCVCVCVCVRACARACVCVCVGGGANIHFHLEMANLFPNETRMQICPVGDRELVLVLNHINRCIFYTEGLLRLHMLISFLVARLARCTNTDIWCSDPSLLVLQHTLGHHNPPLHHTKQLYVTTEDSVEPVHSQYLVKAFAVQ